MRQFLIIFISAMIVSLPAAADESAKPFLKKDHMVVYKKKAKFKDTMEAVKDAITGQGLVINNISHIGHMLERTGKDLGKTKQVYLDAESLAFCSAGTSRTTMEASPHNIVFCPYIISVYVLPSEPNVSYVAYRRPQIVGNKASKKSLIAVEKLLDSVVQEALSW
ncbi:MAG: DUF302 domain-containing protein [Acidiferrobacterales bacterium]